MRSTSFFSFFSTLSIFSAALVTGCGGGETLDFPTGGGGSGGNATTSGGAGGSGGSGGSGGNTASGGSGGAGGGLPACGDGVASPDEACDGDDFKGQTCQDYGFSSPVGLSCTGICLLDTSGCMASCDGALVEPGEDCDGANLNGHDCTEMGFASPDGVACDGCVLDYSGCAAECGNGVAEDGETCDGSDVGMATCVDFGFVNPAGLACNATCSGLDEAGCKAECNGTLEPGEICDGANLNGHDCTELGYSNPAGMACDSCQLNGSACAPTCGNGTKEPGEQCDDGNTQDGDGCNAACQIGGLTCGDAIPVALDLGTQTFTGTTVGGGAFSGTCASAGPSRVYAVTPSAEGFLTASLTRSGTAYPSVLYARTDCANAGTQLLCADSKDPAGAVQLNGGEVISFPVSAGQVIYVFVDGAAANDAGDYELSLDLSAGSTCNDPVPIRLEKGSPMTLLGFVNGKTQSTGGSCGGGAQGFGASDVVYNVNFVGTGTVSAGIDAAGTNYNSVLYARNTCNDGFSQIACDNPAGNGGESISFDPNGDSSISVWVDGSQGAEGYYALVLTPAP